MALIATLGELRRHGVDIALAGVLRNNADQHRQTYRALDDALASDPRLPVLATQIPLRAEFQNAVTAGCPLLVRNPDHIGGEALRRARFFTGRSAICPMGSEPELGVTSSSEPVPNC